MSRDRDIFTKWKRENNSEKNNQNEEELTHASLYTAGFLPPSHTNHIHRNRKR